MKIISNCPITNLERKILQKNFYWEEESRTIVLSCRVGHFKNGQLVENAAISTYIKRLIASDTLVDATGRFLTQEEIEAGEIESYTEYDFYVNVLGTQPIILPDLLDSIIEARDAEGKFNI